MRDRCCFSITPFYRQPHSIFGEKTILSKVYKKERKKRRSYPCRHQGNVLLPGLRLAQEVTHVVKGPGVDGVHVLVAREGPVGVASEGVRHGRHVGVVAGPQRMRGGQVGLEVRQQRAQPQVHEAVVEVGRDVEGALERGPGMFNTGV